MSAPAYSFPARERSNAGWPTARNDKQATAINNNNSNYYYYYIAQLI